MEYDGARNSNVKIERKYIMETLGPTLFDAIHLLVGGQLSGSSGKDGSDSGYNNFIYHDGQTPPTEEVALAKLAELQAEYDAQEYARNRVADYPDMGSQFNKIYDDGLTKWKAEMVDPVKAKWPKDNSGPV